MNSWTFTVDIDAGSDIDGKSEVGCDNCDWRGNLGDGIDICHAVLTPGDPVPACRCPECGALCYPT